MELTSLLERMKIEYLFDQLDGVCEHAAKGDLDHKAFSPRRSREWRGRHQRGVESRLKLARLPNPTRAAPRREPRDKRVGEQGRPYFGAF